MKEFIKLEVDDEVYIIIGVDKRGYVGLDDNYFCTVDKDKDIIKWMYEWNKTKKAK